MKCQVVQKLLSTPLFSFQDLKLSIRDIIGVLKDTLNTTSGPLPILDPHATWVTSNTFERHLIGSRVINGVRNLVISFNMAKLVGSFTSDSTFTYQKGVKNTSLVDLLLNKELPSPLELPLLTILGQQSRWEDIHPKWYFLIHVPNQ
jgi:hypothetical protein